MYAVSAKLLKPLAVSALAASILVPSAPPVQAQNLFDFLFGGNQQYRSGVNRHPPAPQPPDKRKAVKRKKISAPSYFSYKPDPIVEVSFRQLAAAGAENDFSPSLAPSDFDEARDSLASVNLMATKAVGDALNKHYQENPQYIWVTGHHPNTKALEVLAALNKADLHGLSPDDYSVDLPAEGFSFDQLAERQKELMRFEMTLSARVLRYVNDARRGRINPNRLSGYHDLPLKKLSLDAVLSQLAHTREVATYLDTRHPGSREYKDLQAELAELRASQENAIVVNDLKLLKPGGSHPEFPKVMRIIKQNSPEPVQVEFGPLIAANLDSETYTAELVPLIKAAQKAAGTKPDGIIGRNTVAAFFGESKQSKMNRVILAMERLRWLPTQLGPRRVFVNQPAFTATYYEGGNEKLSMRVVVGKRSNQTSFFYDEIETVVYNPYWGVPQSILVNEMLPKLLRDPGYLDRTGYEVTNASGKRVSSGAVDWGQYAGRIPYNVRQTPGRSNALGELKILFPNKHAIYMHDTPAKNLFSRDMRAYSHGCIRLHDPRAMAAAVLGKDKAYVAAKIGSGHSSEQVPQKIPVYVSYFTAWPNANGQVSYYADIYGRDEHLLKSIEIVDKLRTKTGETG